MGAALSSEMKAAYALAFLGLCATVLVVHVIYETPEVAKEDADVEDPFLASLEAHVVAKAQRRLRARDRKMASEAHISEARKAMKNFLLDAHSSNQHTIKVLEAEEDSTKSKTKVKTQKKKADDEKQWSWEELQRGDDVAQERDASEKVGDIMGKLHAAPQSEKAEVEAQQQEEEDQKVDVLSTVLQQKKAEAHVNDDDDSEEQPELKKASGDEQEDKRAEADQDEEDVDEQEDGEEEEGDEDEEQGDADDVVDEEEDQQDAEESDMGGSELPAIFSGNTLPV